IEMVNKGNGLAVGMYSKDGTAENSGEIKIHNLADGVAVGIYADGSTSATNSGTITIDRASYKDDKANNKDSDDVTYTAKSEQGGQAIGIYGASGSHITNTASGVIRINGAERAYGIYTEGGDVTNDGKIYIDGTLKTNQCTGSNCLNQNYAIVLNGGKLFQNGVLASTNSIQTGTMSANTASLNLNDFGGTVVASDTSQFVVEGAISGNLAINNSVVENGFDTTYSVKDMIQAQDTGGLNLQSQSALFDATLQNNTDAVMTMKAFNDVVENSSVADFLQNNYAANNNEDLFKTLKSASSVAQLNSNIDDLFGKSMLSRMAFEDLSMLREVNFDMNNHLFEKEGTFAFGENISPSGYDNNVGSVGRYSLNGYNNGKLSFGFGISITDVRTGDRHGDNRRFDRNFMMSAPIGHRTRGFELITTPKMGYADGVYDRKGLNNITYDGKIQKRMFALMNEARYPLDFGGVKLVPSAEFNMIGYNIKGHEDKEQYALRIKSQNHYSVEAGFGLMAEKEFKPFKNHKFNINGGVAVYHEFANPYQLKVGMNDMDGYYKLQDEKRSDNRTVVRFGLGYELKDNIDVSTSWLTNIDREYRTDANLDLKYRF
ncbi:MAG: autotransporter outer membrane beta-barrel domain-containing protein, partial [Alphaproteobacteria bacterium]